MNFFKRIVSVIFPFKQGRLHMQQDESAIIKEELDLEKEYRKVVAELDTKLREEIHASHEEYEKEYARLEKRFEANGRKTNSDFIILEKELDARYMGISTAIGEKYANLKGKLDIDFFNAYSRAHFGKNHSFTKETGLTEEQLEVSRKILTSTSKLEGSEDTAIKLRSFFDEVMPVIKEYQQNANKAPDTNRTISKSQDELLSKVKSDQIEFDNLINMLNRDLFYLPVKISLEEYRDKLAGKQYKEASSQISFGYEINWKYLIPQRWIEMNPNLSFQLESTVRCTSRFINNMLSYQTLAFNDGTSAECFFELFKNNSQWNYGLNGGVSSNVQSLDERYKVAYTSRQDEFYGDITHQIMLIYR